MVEVAEMQTSTRIQKKRNLLGQKRPRSLHIVRPAKSNGSSLVGMRTYLHVLPPLVTTRKAQLPHQHLSRPKRAKNWFQSPLIQERK